MGRFTVRRLLSQSVGDCWKGEKGEKGWKSWKRAAEQSEAFLRCDWWLVVGDW